MTSRRVDGYKRSPFRPPGISIPMAPPHFVIRQVDPARSRRNWFFLALAWLGSLTLAVVVTSLFLVAKPPNASQIPIDSLDTSALKMRIAVLERSEQVAKAALAELQQTLRDREEEIAGVRADLAFYGRLVGGAKREGLAVHALSLRPVPDSRAWNFSATLTQNFKRGPETRGKLTLTVSGIRNGVLETLEWKDLAQKPDDSRGTTRPRPRRKKMFGSEKRGSRSMSAITTLVAEGTTIRGDIEFDGGLHMDGSVEGSITAQGAKAVLTLSEKGRVNGEIRTPNAVINGQVKGDIIVSERLELAAQARIDGNVYYKVLEMAAGAQLSGKMIYQAEPPRQLSGPGAKTDDESDDERIEAEPAKA